MDLKTITLSVCEIARQAGQYIESERKRFVEDRVERKRSHDYVSYVDKGSERFIVEQTRRLLPEAGFVTEEGSATYGNEQYFWVIDPLDGTTNFIHQYAPYCVSIALCRGREVLLGVVYDVTAHECFYAWQGGGAWCNGQRIGVSKTALDDALLCIQLPYDYKAYGPVAQHLINSFYGRVASIRMMGSAAMALCYVAAGRLDAYMECYIGQWDFMAGALLVKEAGGTVTDYDGNQFFMKGNSVVASNGLFHEVILRELSNATAND